MSVESPIDVDLAQAATAASQLVNQKLQLQGLARVLADLASRQSLVRELGAQATKLRGEISALEGELEMTQARHHERVRQLSEDFRLRRLRAEEDLKKIADACEEKRKAASEWSEQAERAEQRLARVRAALAETATAAAGGS